MRFAYWHFPVGTWLLVVTCFDEPLLFGRTPNHRKVGEAWMVNGSNKQANSWVITDRTARFLPDRLMVGILIREAI